MNLVFGYDDEIAIWTLRRMPWVRDFGPARAIGIASRGRLVAGAVYHDYTGANIQASIAGEGARWCQRGVLRALFFFPFVQLGVRRMTSIIPARNDRSRKLCAGLGFTQEGAHPALFGDEDGLSFGLLRENCRWLEGVRNEQLAA